MIKSKEKTCLCCGENFQMRRCDARYCSEVCKQRAYKERKRMEMAASVSKEVTTCQNKPEIKQGSPVTDNISFTSPIKTTVTDDRTNGIANPNVIIRFSAQQETDPKRVMTHRSIEKRNNEKIDLSEYEGTFILKGYEVPCSWKYFYSEEEIQKMAPEIDEHGEVFFSRMNQHSSICSPEMIDKGNVHLANWINRIFAMAERHSVRVEKLERLEEEIKTFLESFDYRWMMKGYPYSVFIENELHPKIKNWLKEIKEKKAMVFTLTPDNSWKQRYLMVLKDIC